MKKIGKENRRLCVEDGSFLAYRSLGKVERPLRHVKPSVEIGMLFFREVGSFTSRS